MGKSVPAQHPAVVLRSQYRQLRSLVAVLVVAVVGLSTTLVVVAGDEDQVASTATSIHPTYPTLADSFRSESPRPDSRPDESKIAAAISQQSETGPIAPSRAYHQALEQR